MSKEMHPGIPARKPLSILLFLCTLSGPAIAATVFEQATDPRVHPGSSSVLDFYGNSPGRRVADDFVLGANTVVNEVVWWGQHAPPSSKSDDFIVSFYEEKDGFPAKRILESRGKLTSAVHASIPVLTEYRIVLSCPLEAKAGTRYWLSVFNAGSGAAWRWNNSRVGNNHSASAIPPSETEWKGSTGEATDLGFRLGNVPPIGSCETRSYRRYVMPGLGALVLAAGLWIFFRRRKS